MGLKYTRLKIFHYQDKLDSLPQDSARIMPPIHIRIKPTNACNHNCWYCAYRAENLQLGKDMVIHDSIPHDKMVELVADISEMGVKAVTFSGGGDPFCYPHLAEAAKRLSQTPVRFASLTNGSRLSGEVAEVFAHHAEWLRVSMDGWDDASYTHYRRVSNGEFTRIMHNLEAFKKFGGRCYLGVCIIAGTENASHLYELTRRLKETGVDSVKIAPCIVSNSSKENNDYHQPIFETVKAQIGRAVDELANGKFEIFDAYHDQLETFGKTYRWCPYLQILPVIGADLNVYSCQDKAYNLEEGLIGSIKGARFKDFWFSDKSKFFRLDPSQVCSHHCVANAKNLIIHEYLEADREHLGFV